MSNVSRMSDKSPTIRVSPLDSISRVDEPPTSDVSASIPDIQIGGSSLSVTNTSKASKGKKKGSNKVLNPSDPAFQPYIMPAEEDMYIPPGR